MANAHESDGRTWRREFADWSMRLADGAIKNTTATVAITTVVLFTVARVPTQIFYAELGTSPDAVGLNSVQGLLQTTTPVLLLGLFVGLSYGVGIPVLILLYGWIFRSLGKTVIRVLPDSKVRRWLLTAIDLFRISDRPLIEDLRLIIRMGPVLVPVITLLFAAVLMVSEAFEGPDLIKAGKNPGLSFAPWSARQVDVIRTSDRPQSYLSGCRNLFYLGENNGHMVLFDSASETTVQLQSDQIELRFPNSCS